MQLLPCLSSVKTPHGLRLDRAATVKQAGNRFLRDRVTELQSPPGHLALGEMLRRHRDAPSLSVEVTEADVRLLPGLSAELDADLRGHRHGCACRGQC